MWPCACAAGSRALPAPSQLFDFEGYQYLLFAPQPASGSGSGGTTAYGATTGGSSSAAATLNTQSATSAAGDTPADSSGGWMSFDMAEDTCRQAGGALASVHSAALHAATLSVLYGLPAPERVSMQSPANSTACLGSAAAAAALMQYNASGTPRTDGGAISLWVGLLLIGELN